MVDELNTTGPQTLAFFVTLVVASRNAFLETNANLNLPPQLYVEADSNWTRGHQPTNEASLTLFDPYPHKRHPLQGKTVQ